MTTHLLWLAPALAGIAGLLAGSTSYTHYSRPCTEAEWAPPATKQTVRVDNVAQLYDAVDHARPDTTILLRNGEYRLHRTLEVVTPRLVIRSERGDKTTTILRGEGMSERRVGVAIGISSQEVTLAHVTIGYVAQHGVQIRGERGASRAMLQDVHVIDTGQQLIKGSAGVGPLYADDGVLACSTLEYSNHAPSDYTNGIDVIAGTGWVVRDNIFRRIRGPVERSWSAGPTILFWGNSQNTRVERNLIVDSFRGIAFGLGPGAMRQYARDHEPTYDHQGGWIRNNAILNLNRWADEGIEANAARDVAIDHNTVFVEGQLPWSISLRFAQTAGRVRNNLTNRMITFRNGGHADVQGNVTGAQRHWFLSAPSADLRLTTRDLPAVDAAVPIAEIAVDALRQPRVSGRAADAGAYEFRSMLP